MPLAAIDRAQVYVGVLAQYYQRHPFQHPLVVDACHPHMQSSQVIIN
jgi:hypothetical protein